MRNHRSLSPGQAAARLNISVADLPRLGLWTRERVRSLRTQRPEWLTRARRDYGAGKELEAARVRKAVQSRSPDARCLCCQAAFAFTVDSGGLCGVCNEGQCPGCGQAGEWRYG